MHNEKIHGEKVKTDLSTRLEQARDLILAGLAEHERDCPRRLSGEWCPEKANALAYLAHSIGATQRDLAEMPRLLLRYDLECMGCGSARDRAGAPKSMNDQ